MDLARALPSAFRVPAMLMAIFVAQAQDLQKEFTDPVALLKAVAKTYAVGVDTFRMESVSETTSNADLHHEWRKVYQTAIKGPGNLYRIETRSPFGSMIQDSDGTNEWVYQIEGKMYVKRPLPQNWPEFSKLYFGGNNEVMSAWSMCMSLESTAAGYKEAAMLPQETISIEGHSFPCYVVHVTSNNSTSGPDKDSYSDTTFWIDKTALVFRKQVRHVSSYAVDSANRAIRIPFLEDSTTIYPAADLNPRIDRDTFRFTPPADAKEVAKLEPDWFVSAPSAPKITLAGQPAPDVSFSPLTAARSHSARTVASRCSWTSGPPGAARALLRCPLSTVSTWTSGTRGSPLSRSTRTAPPRMRLNTSHAIIIRGQITTMSMAI